ncbi:MAG: PAS domain-containing sensor histidine kinase [Saprospiraceae bacterium]
MENKNDDFALRLQAIIDTAIDGIITIDTKGIVESVNPAVGLIFGYDVDEITGKNVSVLMPQPHQKNHNEYLDNYHRTRKPKIIGIGREVLGKKKSGELFPIRIAISEVKLNNKVIYTGIIHDLSEVKLAQDKIIELNRQLEKKVDERTYELEKVVNKLLSTNTELSDEISKKNIVEQKLKVQEKELKISLEKEIELNELKSRFVSMASHEFRTPLTSILSSALLIGRYTNEEQQIKREKHINRIKSSVSNLTLILDDFLSLSKLEEGKVNVNLTTLNLETFFKNTIEEIAVLLKANQSINYKLSEELSTVKVDEIKLKNILFNLLSNAIKYSDSDINCTVLKNGDNFQINVVDSGIGIPLEEQKHMFSRFFRAKNATNIKGTGLGLNIVKEYIGILNGTISFVSVVDEGTKFIVEIPINI